MMPGPFITGEMIKKLTEPVGMPTRQLKISRSESGREWVVELRASAFQADEPGPREFPVPIATATDRSLDVALRRLLDRVRSSRPAPPSSVA